MAQTIICFNQLLQASPRLLITRPKPKPPVSPSRPPRVSCIIASNSGHGLAIDRRSANYHPNIWDFDFIKSLNSDYKGKEKQESEAEKLEDGVRNKLNDQKVTELAQLELIDALQRMGLGYKFEKEIKIILKKISTCYESSINQAGIEEDLHIIALRFRLLRQHGYHISSQDSFNIFKDENGKFKESLCKNVQGMLSLYEASYYALEAEDDTLDEAKLFTTRHLRDMEGQIANPKLAKLVSHSLELPLHWRMLTLEARWYITACSVEEDDNINYDLIKLAKLNFNIMQTTYQEELRELSRWWKNLGLGSHPQLRFARDRLVECFLWSAGIVACPQDSNCRKQISKIIQLLTVIDDVYDVYGFLDELELFTDAIERWDINAMEQLPNYMKLCFLAVFNNVNEMVYDTLTEKNLDVLRHMTKAWADVCKAYLKEAKWYYNKYTPTLQEYLDNGWISIAGPVILTHTFFSLKQEITKGTLEFIQEHDPNIVRWSSKIVRLLDDLATSKDEIERGDVPSSIQCYMHETGESEEAARQYIKHLIEEYWKKLNEELIDHNSKFPDSFIRSVGDFNRIAHMIYQDGLDGLGISNGVTKDAISSLVVEPMSLVE